MDTLFVVRHGESGWNREHLVQGQSPDAPGLTAAGQQQAAATAAYLAGVVAGRRAGPAATVVLASDLRRTVETAAPIARRLGAPVWVEPRLRERALGAAEGCPNDQVGPAELGFTGQVVTDPDASPAGGESLRQLYDRVTRLLSDLLAGNWPAGDQHPGDQYADHPNPGDPNPGDPNPDDGAARTRDRQVVLVTHGGPVRVARAYLAGLGVGEMRWAPVPNASVLEVPCAPAVLDGAVALDGAGGGAHDPQLR